jgi:L-2-hydroxyglutarate oxidase LhgO
MQTFDVLIIGNGILGYSTAYALFMEDPSLKIGIIGPSNCLAGATKAAGAMLGCFGEITKSGQSSLHGIKKPSRNTHAK